MVQGAIALDGGRLFVGGSKGGADAWALPSMEPLWSSRQTGRFSEVHVGPDGLEVRFAGWLFAGGTWRRAPDLDPPEVASLELWQTVGGLVVEDRDSGKLLGQVMPVWPVLGAVSADGRLVVTLSDAGAEGWSPATGERLWTRPLVIGPFPKIEVEGSAVEGSSVLVHGGTDNEQYVLAAATGRLLGTVRSSHRRGDGRAGADTVVIEASGERLDVSPGQDAVVPGDWSLPSLDLPRPLPHDPEPDVWDALERAGLKGGAKTGIRATRRPDREERCATVREAAAELASYAPLAPLLRAHEVASCDDRLLVPVEPPPVVPWPDHAAPIADFEAPRLLREGRVVPGLGEDGVLYTFQDSSHHSHAVALPLQRDRPTLVLTGTDEVDALARDIPLDVDVLWLTDSEQRPLPRLRRSQVRGAQRVENGRGEESMVRVEVAHAAEVRDTLGLAGDEALLVSAGARVLVRGPVGTVLSRLAWLGLEQVDARLPRQVIRRGWAYTAPEIIRKWAPLEDGGALVATDHALSRLDHRGDLRWTREGASRDLGDVPGTPWATWGDGEGALHLLDRDTGVDRWSRSGLLVAAPGPTALLVEDEDHDSFLVELGDGSTLRPVPLAGPPRLLGDDRLWILAMGLWCAWDLASGAQLGCRADPPAELVSSAMGDLRWDRKTRVLRLTGEDSTWEIAGVTAASRAVDDRLAAVRLGNAWALVDDKGRLGAWLPFSHLDLTGDGRVWALQGTQISMVRP